jgi:hypothetical protein
VLSVISQIGIALFGVSAVFLVGVRNKRLARWGYVAGVCGQPFWMYATFVAEQWGIFLLTVVYSYCWVNGLRNHWRQIVE